MIGHSWFSGRLSSFIEYHIIKNVICLGVAGNGAAIGYLWIPQSVNSQASHLRQETMEGVGH